MGIIYVTAGSFTVIVIWVVVGIALSIITSIFKGKHSLKNNPKIIEMKKNKPLMWHLKYLVILFACLILVFLLVAPTVFFGHFILLTPAILTFAVSYMIGYSIVWLYTQFIRPQEEKEGDKYESNI
jgi:phosphatidylglycerophosphate synthase